jgi:hypothetical protein
VQKLGLEEGLELKPPLVEFFLQKRPVARPTYMCRTHKAFEPGRRLANPKYERDGTENQPGAQGVFSKGMGYCWWTLSWSLAYFPMGSLAVIDEISPDTCRLWDAKTREKLDKDRFRFDLGDLMEGYRKVLEKNSRRINHQTHPSHLCPDFIQHLGRVKLHLFVARMGVKTFPVKTHHHQVVGYANKKHTQIYKDYHR